MPVARQDGLTPGCGCEIREDRLVIQPWARVTGKVTIEKFEGDTRTEIFEDHAIWELMYFGKTRPQALEMERRLEAAR